VLAALLGHDYVAARYVIAALVPALVVVACGGVQHPAAALAMAGLCALSVYAVVADDSSPTLQRQDFRGAARALGPPSVTRALVMTPNTFQGPFDVYFPGATRFSTAVSPPVREVDVVALAVVGDFSTGQVHPPGLAPPPHLPGFVVAADVAAPTYTLIRYLARTPRVVGRSKLVGMVPFARAETGVWLERPIGSASGNRR
jgi:hypothetical protein